MRKFLVTAGFLGCGPVAPGTWGTLAGVAIYALAVHTPWREAVIVVALAVTFAANIWLCPWAEAHYGRKDPSPFVIDEVAGYLVSVLALGNGEGWIFRAVAAFFAFRFFDVVKPFPARRLEKLPAGWGIVLDDLVAGVYANVATRLAVLVALHFSFIHS